MVAGNGHGKTVGEVAALSGVSVRTLHHYEAIGLLEPGERSPAGYRIYTDADIDRLTRILYYREIDLSLNDIMSLLEDDQPVAHLTRQRDLIRARLAHNERLLAAIDGELEAHSMNHTLTPEEKLEVFGDFDVDRYEEEARDQWGDTGVWQESKRRTSQYSKDVWLTIRAEMDDLAARQLAAMQAGISPASKAGMDLAEEHRQQITNRFYTCSPEMHRCLADLFVADERYAINLDAAGEGLSAWLGEAIRADAARQEAT